MSNTFKFLAFDRVNGQLIQISSLNFDDSGLVQLSGFTQSGKLIHVPITDILLHVSSDDIDKLSNRLDSGRYYLMQATPKDLNVSDALEAFGFDETGHNKF